MHEALSSLHMLRARPFNVTVQRRFLLKDQSTLRSCQE